VDFFLFFDVGLGRGLLGVAKNGQVQSELNQHMWTNVLALLTGSLGIWTRIHSTGGQMLEQIRYSACTWHSIFTSANATARRDICNPPQQNGF